MKYLLLLNFVFQATQANAQSSCSSDTTAPVKAISERFTNANCESCWTEPALTNKRGVTLDWLAPSPSGDDAPLSAAANRDALLRLENLQASLPKEQLVVKTVVSASDYKVRVAHGLAVGDYIGASIKLTKSPSLLTKSQHLTAVLLLTETIPKGTADSPIERNLVRNMLIESWVVMPQSPKRAEKQLLLTRRPLSIPQGTNPDNLRVFGWVQDDKGRVLAAAQSLCSELK